MQYAGPLLVGSATVNHGLPHAHGILPERKDVVREDDDLVLQLHTDGAASALSSQRREHDFYRAGKVILPVGW